MKVIDLLNKIANGEEVPKTFIYNDYTFSLDDDRRYRDDENDYLSYSIRYDFEDLNEEIKIIEDKKEDKKIKRIGKLNQVEDKQNLNNYMLRDKINEIIDFINKGE